MSLQTSLAVLGSAFAAAGVLVAYLQLKRTPRIRRHLRPEAAASESADNGPAIRHNLPPREEFVGRAQEVSRVFEGLTSLYPIVSIEGLGGMGKTSIAKEVAWRCVSENFGFNALVWAQDSDGTLALNDLLDVISDVLGYPYIIKLSGERKESEVLALLRRVKTLVLVDNLDTTLDRSLLAFIARIPQPPSKVLVTSRMKQLRAAWAVPLDRLTPEDGIAVIRQESLRVGSEMIGAGARALSSLYDATGGNPLAMRLTVGQIQVEGASLAEVVQGLAVAEENAVFAIIYDHSWNSILKEDEYARRVMMTLSLFPSSVSREALQEGCDLHGGYLRSALTRLIELSLVNVLQGRLDEDPRYALHTLTRAFVRRQMAKVAPTESDLKRRLMDYFAMYAGRHANTYGDILNIKKLDIERLNLLSFADTAYQQANSSLAEPDWRRVITYAEELSSYLWGRGFWDDRMHLSNQALHAAQVVGDDVAAARQLASIGRVYLWRKELSAASEYCRRSEQSLSSPNDPLGRAPTKRLRAQIASAEGDFECAHALLMELLKDSPLTVDDEGRSATLLELGIVAERQGNLHEARQRYEEALSLDEQLHTAEGKAVSLSHLGETLLKLGENAAAAHAFEQGLSVAKEVNRLSVIGRCQIGLARVYADAGTRTMARQFASQAEETFRRLGLTDMVDQAAIIAR